MDLGTHRQPAGLSRWAKVLDVNVVGTARTVRPPSPTCASRHRLPSSSIASWAGIPSRAVYSASKGAPYAFTLAMAADHLADGIRVNGVAPGTG